MAGVAPWEECSYSLPGRQPTGESFAANLSGQQHRQSKGVLGLSVKYIGASNIAFTGNILIFDIRHYNYNSRAVSTCNQNIFIEKFLLKQACAAKGEAKTL